jgi:pimeloyl-ACP methyl ester carboxylesterase
MASYIDLRGHQVFSYEWPHDGEAVVLLHGGLSQTSHWNEQILPAVEDSFHTFGYDRTGHGFTGDRSGSFHFDFQTNEAIEYLEDVVKEPAHLIGYSDGANIALMVAIKRPDLVKSIVSIAANYHHSGIHPLPDFDGNIAQEDRDEYAITSPDPAHTFDEKIRKMSSIWKVEPDIAQSDLAKIQCPVLVMAGDDDVVRHDHTIDLFEKLPLGQLAIVPGTSHGLVKEKPAIVQALIEDFLGDLSYPVTRMPIKRTNPSL